LSFQIVHYEEIDSTNSEAWRLIDCHKASANTVIISKRQTKGRGQRGNIWQSDLGGLFMSVILQPNLAAANAHQITLWSAWGIAKALNETGANVKLKWLNDLLIDRRKLGGILTETRIEAGKIRYAVVGIGLNWTNAVPENAIALGELPTTLSSMDELIEVVLKGIKMGQNRCDREGMMSILAEYLEMLNDKNVHQTINGRELQGQIIDIRSTGELVVRWEGNSQEAIYQPQNFSVGYQ
jgi:BirA family transcriptional regulator, biotin operon repressor / biotin---[acetyl-CoA-carboxylase] ligase